MTRKTINDIMESKKMGNKISMITAYDYFSAKLLDQVGIDIILVGDSLGMVIQGKDDTLSVSLKDMIYHTSLVKRGSSQAMIVADLPFMTYQVSVEDALKNAGRLIKESGAGAVKLEGGKNILSQIKAIVNSGIPVMGHLGLTPQSVNKFGGYKLQAKNKEDAERLIEDALLLQEAGVFSIVLEKIPLELSKLVRDRLDIPVIGIGAGPYCDGQVLVFHDLLGFDNDFNPGFVRKYADLNSIIKKAVSEYIDDINDNKFPAEKESYPMDKDIYNELKED
ncbi:MAG: 3-methyl-2-oxobutanoate hydroxymethyltransferase [Halanaerobiaceae bacterium]